MNVRPVALLGLVVVPLILLPGCKGPVPAPVTGRVTCNGKPVVDASLIFSPIPKDENDREPGKAAAGATNQDGIYTLSTYQVGDGALIGNHRVSITMDNIVRSDCKSKVVVREVVAGDNVINIELNE